MSRFVGASRKARRKNKGNYKGVVLKCGVTCMDKLATRVDY